MNIFEKSCCVVCSHKLTLSQAKLMEAEFQLSGSDAYAARFGETIAELGDIDDDGYPGNTNTSAAQSNANTLTILIVNITGIDLQL